MKKHFFSGMILFLIFLFQTACLAEAETIGPKSLTKSYGIASRQEEQEEQENLLDQVLEESGLSFGDIEESLENSSLSEDISFTDILKQLWSGQVDEAFEDIWNMVKDNLFSEVIKNWKNFVQIILLAVFAALFSNVATGMFASSLQDTGFYAAYLALSGIVLHSFFLMVDITEEALMEVFAFMEAFIPAYTLAITMVSGSMASIGIYELTFLLVKGCQWALKTLVLPLIEIYMLIGVINCFGATDKFSYLGDLIKKGTEQLLKWTTAVILGLSLIQNMILPAFDSVKSSIWQRGLSAIPGAGAVISALTGTLLGASVLIKNSIGVGCLIILILLCSVPVLKMLTFMLSFYLSSAFLQPISDKRLMSLLHVTGECGKLFLQTLITCFVLFFITIALAAVSTNMRYYAG